MKRTIIALVAAVMAGSAQAAGRDSGPLAASVADIGAASPDVSMPAEGVYCADKTGAGENKFCGVSRGERKQYIAGASLWLPEESLDTAALDFGRGPFTPLRYKPEENVNCSYIPKEGSISGKTPKFKCRDLRDGKSIKVKYGVDNGEVYAEVAASWVLTAIGAYADRMYPVRLTCPDCPSDPFYNESDKGSWRPGARVAVEDKLGERIEVKADSGISFAEFHLIQDRVGAEALIGLTHFLGNSDNKASNQAIVCKKEDIREEGGRARCAKPVIYMQDMGVTFGVGGVMFLSRGKMDFDGWASVPVWDDPAACIMYLQKFATSSLDGTDDSGRNMHQIGEQARRMLVRRLSLLSREQLINIFTAARAPARQPLHSAEEWADLYLKKVEELRNPRKAGNGGAGFACKYDIVPANSAPIPPPVPDWTK